MRKVCLYIFLIVFTVFFASCGDKSSSGFPMGKRYWTSDDYTTVNEKISNLKYDGKELPNLDNPKTRAIFQKIVDTTNFSIVANDDQLGMEHRKDFLTALFNEYQDLLRAYTETDRSDKYKYGAELIEIEKFGLALQVYYFTMGNQKIIKTADDPNEASVVDIVNKNNNIMIHNYTLYLEHVNYEDRFSEKVLENYSQGLQAFFPKLITTLVPNGDYSGMRVKVENMLKKSKNPSIIAQLQNIQNLLNSKIVAVPQ